MKTLVLTSAEVNYLEKGRKTQIRFPYLPFLNTSACVPGMTRPVCPYGEAGDILMVKEAWRPARIFADPDEEEMLDTCLVYVPKPSSFSPFEYLADVAPSYQEESGVWSSPESMPELAGRFFVQIERVWVQHLHEASIDDCIAEGMPAMDNGPRSKKLPRTFFQNHWNSMYGEGSWSVNPVVWALSFKRVAAPESGIRSALGGIHRYA